MNILQVLLDNLMKFLGRLRQKEQQYVVKQSDYRKRVVRLIDLYAGNITPHLQGALDNQFAKPRNLKLQLAVTNVVRYLVDSVADYVKHGLTIDAKKESEQIIYDKIIDDNHFDLFCQQLAKMIFLVKTVMVRVAYVNDKICLNILTPQYIEAKQNEYESTEADAIIYPKKIMKFENFRPIGEFAYWDVNGAYKVVNENGKVIANPDNPENVNPYRDPKNPEKTIIPLAIFRESIPMANEFWIWPGDEIDNAAISICIKRTYLNFLIKLQSFSQPVIERGNTKFDAVVVIDPSMPIVLESSETKKADYRFVTPEPKITEVVDAIDKEIIELFGTYGINPQDFLTSRSARSAEGIQAANARLQEFRDNQKLMFVAQLQRLFDIIRIVWNTHNPDKQLSEDGVIIRLMEARIHPEAVKDRIELHNWELEKNLTTLPELMVEEEEDLTIQEAEEKILENAKINSDLANKIKALLPQQTPESGSIMLTEESGSQEISGSDKLFKEDTQLNNYPPFKTTTGNTPLTPSENPERDNYKAIGAKE